MDDRTREWAQIAFAQSSVEDIVTALMAKADEEMSEERLLSAQQVTELLLSEIKAMADKNAEIRKRQELEDILAELSLELERQKNAYELSAKRTTPRTGTYTYQSIAMGYSSSMEMLRHRLKPTGALKNAQRRRYQKRKEARDGQGNPGPSDP